MLSGVNDYGGKCKTFELASSVHRRPPMLFYFLNFVSVRHQQCTSNNPLNSFNKLLFLNKAMLKGKREKERGKAEMFADE